MHSLNDGNFKSLQNYNGVMGMKMKDITKGIHCSLCKLSPRFLHIWNGECEYIVNCKSKVIRVVTTLPDDEYLIKEIRFDERAGTAWLSSYRDAKALLE